VTIGTAGAQTTDVPSLYVKASIPILRSSAGSMGNGGIFTLNVPFLFVYANAYIYLPASALFLGSAEGIYFCKMSTLSVGQVFQEQLTPGFMPTIPKTPTPWSSVVGPRGWIPPTVPLTLLTVNLPAGTIQPNGLCRISHLWSMTPSANIRRARICANGSADIYNLSPTNTVQGIQAISTWWNRGSSIPYAGTPPAAPDTTPPTVPTALVFTNVVQNSLTVGWTPSTDIGGTGVAGYKVYRNGVQVGTTGVTPTFNDTGLSPGVTYNYTVSAFDFAIPPNNSAQSATFSQATLPIVPIAPTVPTGLAASNILTTSMDLSWNPASSLGSGVGGYKLYRDGSLLINLPGNILTYHDTGLAQWTTYSYQVSAYDTLGPVESNKSSAVPAQTDDDQAPSVPIGLATSAPTSSTIQLDWNISTDPVPGSGLGGYYVYRDGVSIAQIDAPAHTFTDTGLSPSTTYGYKVASFDNRGPPHNFSVRTSNVNGTTSAAPATRSYNPGHYISLLRGGNSATQADMKAVNASDTLNGGSNVPVKGFEKFYAWRDLNPSSGTFTFAGETNATANIVADLAYLATQVSATNPQGQHLIITIEERSFTADVSGSNPAGKLVPTWIDALGTVNLPAQGMFGCQCRNSSGSSSDLTTNAAGGYTPYIHTALHTAKYNLLLDALAAAFDTNPNLEGVSTQETATGLYATKTAADNAWHANLPVNQGGTAPYGNEADCSYSGAALTTEMVNIITHAQTVFLFSQFFWGVNFISGNQAGVQTCINAMPVLPIQGVVYGGPDMYPEDSGIGHALNNNVYQYYSTLNGNGAKYKRKCRVSDPCYSIPHTATGKVGTDWSATELFNFAANTPSDGKWQSNQSGHTTGQTMNTGPLQISYMLWMNSGSNVANIARPLINTKAGAPPIP